MMPCSVILPAGYGKTELLANIAILGSRGHRTLILTHTNAGVSALRSRLHRKNPKNPVSVTTISAFAERIVFSYPLICGYRPGDDESTDFRSKHVCGSRFIRSAIGKRVVASSWERVLVDEYQDCSASQHEMIRALSEVVPVLVVGDPLQAIFDFPSEPVVDWDLIPLDFPLATVASAPRRWAKTNPGLGAELELIRKQIIDRNPIDLRGYECIEYARYNRQYVPRLSKTAHELPGQSVIIHPGQSHAQSVKLAGNLKNRFSAIERRAMPELRALCRELDGADGPQIVDLVLEAAQRGTTNMGPAKEKLVKIAAGERPRTLKTTAVFGVASAGIRCADEPSPATITDLVEAILSLDGLTVSRRQFWADFHEVLRIANRSTVSFEEALEALRSKRQRSVLRPSWDIVARPLMVKGLEFANVLVLDANKFGTRELYVAATRACSSLVISSEDPILRPWDNDKTPARAEDLGGLQGRLL